MTLNLSGGLTLVSMVVSVIILPFVSQNKRKLLSTKNTEGKFLQNQGDSELHSMCVHIYPLNYNIFYP